jgi:hypothetical protein
MKRYRIRSTALSTAVALGACVFCVPPLSATASSATVAAAALPACIAYEASARGRNLGYDHIVRIRSTCIASAACLVATNVDPKPKAVTVFPRSEVEVVTRVGSPAREFIAEVSCTLP